MTEPVSSLRRAFLASPHHAIMALATLGAGFVSGEQFYLLLGATAYILGWIYLPDMQFFRRWIGKRKEAADAAAARAEVENFIKKRDALLASLPTPLRERYHTLAQVCRAIENAAAESEDASAFGADARLRKLDELMWMFLRLLRTEQSLQSFLAAEQHEDLGAAVTQAEAELAALNEEIGRDKGQGMSVESKERLAESRAERLEVLRKRLIRREESRANLALILAEQERLTEQIKLIRADAVAMRNTDALTARIDASVAHLNETNKWLSELDEFKELAGDLPQSDQRVGFAPTAPTTSMTASGTAPPANAAQRERPSPARERDRA
jgi:hypothetical protein